MSQYGQCSCSHSSFEHAENLLTHEVHCIHRGCGCTYIDNTPFEPMEEMPTLVDVYTMKVDTKEHGNRKR